MKEQKIKKSLEDQLLDARKTGLDNLQETHSIRAHGKALGMNVFSWANPHVDTLANWIDSMPFKLKWMTTFEQANKIVKLYPELAAKVHYLIVFNANGRNAEISACAEWKNVLCIEDVHSGLSFIRNGKREDSTLLFSSDSDNWKSELDQFENFISAIG